mgnify:FL=1
MIFFKVFLDITQYANSHKQLIHMKFAFCVKSKKYYSFLRH